MTLPYPIPANEAERLRVLDEYDVMDTGPEPGFERITSLAARVFDAPIVLVSLIAADRQFFKSRQGIDVCETSREASFCTHAIMSDEIMLVPDATLDPRFAKNPFVIGPPFVRFYAGKPLAAPTGESLGAFCIIDTKPRNFDAEDRANLEDLARMVVEQLETRRLHSLQASNQSRFENIAATSPDAIICSDAERRITFWNKAAERLFGYSADELANASSDIIIPERARRGYEAEISRLVRGEKLALADRTVEVAGLRRDGTEFPAELSLSTWKEGPRSSVGAIVRDITERREHEDRLFRLASRDPLTDLPNRGSWQTQLQETAAEGRAATVLLLDLDGFKHVNDTLGHAAGDAVLREAAQRLREVCADATMVARLGGDEFVVLVDGEDQRAATALAGRIVAELSEPYIFGEHHPVIGTSVGLAMMPRHGRLAEDILNAADLALYRAKSAGKGGYTVFEPMFREAAVARREFEDELRRAYEERQFELFYQPQVSLADGRIVGAEALLRWNHPDRGLLSPASFIDVLNKKTTASGMGDWVLDTACRQAAAWRASVPGFRIAVNLFERQARSGRLVESVRAALRDSGLPAQALELEIVESIFLRTDTGSLRLLQDLRALGCGLAFDDYGTGYASLSLLQTYPVSRLKIDRTFVRNLPQDAGNAAVVRALLFLGEAFGIEVIAEGVETAEQAAFLRDLSCSEAQGYHFGGPVPAEEFDRLLA